MLRLKSRYGLLNDKYHLKRDLARKTKMPDIKEVMTEENFDFSM